MKHPTIAKAKLMELIAAAEAKRADRFDDAYAHAGTIPDQGRAAYVAGKGPLAKYLRVGMEKLGL